MSAPECWIIGPDIWNLEVQPKDKWIIKVRKSSVIFQPLLCVALTRMSIPKGIMPSSVLTS